MTSKNKSTANKGYSVVIVDPQPLAPWPNTYGVWCDEFEAMGLDDCLEFTWPRANVFLDSTAAGKRELRRPYGRVDRAKLKRRLLDRCIDNGVAFVEARAEGVEHGSSHSTLSLSSSLRGSGNGNGGGSSGSSSSSSSSSGSGSGASTSTPSGGAPPDKVEARVVLDATGHSRKLVQWDQPFDPGYQGAYGIAATVDAHPFALDSMLFMDWRDDHTVGHPEMRARNQRIPTFLYAMPFSPTEVFLEETSLVARPAVGFEELRERLERRLEHLEIRVRKIHEVERCLIPMGGALPRLPQRTVGVGGAAGMVHPSTGYMVARALGAAPGLGDAIVDALADEFRVAPRGRGRKGKGSPLLFGASPSGGGGGGGAAAALSSSPPSSSKGGAEERGPVPSPSSATAATVSEGAAAAAAGEASTSPSSPPSSGAAAAATVSAAALASKPVPPGAADAASTAAWASLWPMARLRQRAFFCFGMDVLLSLDLAETRVREEGRERGNFCSRFFFLVVEVVAGCDEKHLCFTQKKTHSLFSFSFPSLSLSPHRRTTKNTKTSRRQEFFSAFFSLSEKNWTGFLSSRLGFSELIAFGLSLFAKSSNAARADLLIKGLPGLVVMLAQLATMKAVRSEKR